MKEKTIVAAFLAALLVVSCSDDDTITLPHATQPEGVTATAAVADATPAWVDGAKLAVSYDDAAYTKRNDLTISAGAGTANATFTGTLDAPLEKTTMRFYYPAAVAEGEYKITKQDATTPGNYVVMYAQTAAGTAPALTMASKTAVLTLDFAAPSDATTVTSATVKGCYGIGTLGADAAWTDPATTDITLKNVAVADGKITGSCVVLPGTVKRALQVEIVAGGKTYTTAPYTDTSKLEAGKTYTVQQPLVETVPSAPRSITWVPIQGGTATINGKQVTLADYEISATEITNAQWVEFLNKVDEDHNMKPDLVIDSEIPVNQLLCKSTEQYKLEKDKSTNKDKYVVSPGCENLPVTSVTWYGAKSFATYNGWKLMTECQFEYAVQKIEAIPGYAVDSYAWTIDNSGNTFHAVATATAAAIGKNGEQVYDLLGNMWEWCQDWYGEAYPSATTDPTGATSGHSRVLRGGGWNSPATAAGRNLGKQPDTYSSTIGFRVAK